MLTSMLAMGDGGDQPADLPAVSPMRSSPPPPSRARLREPVGDTSEYVIEPGPPRRKV
jgi:hypothetical protein